MIIVSILVAVVACLLAALYLLTHKTPDISIPGPPDSMFGRLGGNFPGIELEGAKTMAKYYNTYKPFFRICLGAFPVAYVTSPELIFEIFSKRKVELLNRPSLSNNQNILTDGGIFRARNDDWTRIRRLISPSFSSIHISNYSDTFIGKSDELVNHWVQTVNTNNIIQIHESMSFLTASVITKSAFDYDMSPISVNDEMYSALNTIFIPSVLIPLIPYWQHVPTPFNLKFMKSVRFIQNTVMQLIERRVKLIEEIKSNPNSTVQVPQDLLQSLIDAEDKETGDKFTVIQVFNEAMSFFIAGHETTSTTLTWCFYLLSQNPHVEEKLLKELDKVIGGKEVNAENIKDLEYMRMVIDETLRMYPTANQFLREAEVPVELGGVKFPKKAAFSCHIWALHHTDEYFPDPFKFDPERFSVENSKNIVPWSYLPFGLGPHVCPGQKFALTEAKIILAKILQKFTLSLVDGEKPEPQIFILTRPKKDFQMKLNPRKVYYN